MAGLNRRFALTAFVLLSFMLAISGMARAGTFTVTTTADTGAGSLRAAITSANLTPTVASTINFSVSGPITLGSPLPAIANTSPGSLTIDGSGQAITVDGASAHQVLIVNSGAKLIVQNLTIANGVSAFGGGIINSGTLTVNNCTFSGNSGTSGGGIYNSGGAITITNSTFSGNGSGDGGGIDNFSGTLTVTNSTFSGNSTENFGGGILNNVLGTVAVTNCTFSGNNGPVNAGGGIANFGSATLKGTVLAASTGGNCSVIALPTDAGYNISDDGSCGFSGTSINNSTTLHLDPTGLQNNGGPTKTIALEPDSDAVDFIPVADCTDQSSPTPLRLTTDQRGFRRPDPGNPFFCDAGAYELQTSGSFILNSEKIQIARSTTTSNADQVNMALTFSDTPNPTCDAADDVLHHGISVQLFAGSCSDLMGTGLTLDLSPFVVHMIGGESYGTLFQSEPPLLLEQPSETVSARIVTLTTPEGTCGKWTLNIEVGGLDTATLGLMGNPFALELTDSDLRGFGCFDIDNAIVGNQITPPTRAIRRGVRR
jgi:hypothetical protein